MKICNGNGAHCAPGVSWVDPEQIHATIIFLGNIPEACLPTLLLELRALARITPGFEVTYEGLGTFPDLDHAEMLWIGCVSAGGRLQAMKRALDDAVRRSGVQVAPQPFRPHMTLGRVRQALAQPET